MRRTFYLAMTIAVFSTLLGGVGAQVAKAAEGQYSDPVWLPLRSPAKVGCVVSNCDAGRYHGYWALDLLGAENDPVHPAGAGRLSIESESQACGGPGTPGNYVSVDHGGGVKTRYLHLRSIDVPNGAWVTPTDVIGRMGSTGYNDPCPTYHLHFEIQRGGSYSPIGTLKACNGSDVVNYPSAFGVSSWNDLSTETVSVASTHPSCVARDTLSPYLGKIVKQDGDPTTAWLVTNDLKRHWIPTGTDYNCLVEFKAVPGGPSLPQGILGLTTDAGGD